MTLDVSKLVHSLCVILLDMSLSILEHTLADGPEEIHLDPLHMHREVKLFGKTLCTFWVAVSAE